MSPSLTQAAPKSRPTAVLSARNIRKSFALGERTLEILHGVNLDLYQGEMLALTGTSGAGKSTLLHILGLLDRPSEGTVSIEGKGGWDLSLSERARIRNQRIGFVFQFYHLLPELNAVENVLLPARLLGGLNPQLRARAQSLLEVVGLADRLTSLPAHLSGGERQRVALARALMNRPALILADEPTGNLDERSGARVMDQLLQLCRSERVALLLVTHSPVFAERCDRVLWLHEGNLGMDPVLSH